MQALQTQVQNEGALGALHAAQIAHQLGSGLGDVGAGQTEALGVGHTMVALVRGTQAGKLLGIGGPVELAAVHDAAAHGSAVAVHVLGGGMGHDVRAPLEGPAVHRSGKGVVHDQGHAVGVGRLGELLNVQHGQCGVGDGLAEHSLGVGPEGSVQLLLGAVRVHEGELHAHPPHGHREQVVGAAVNAGAAHHMVAAARDVEHRIEVGCLAAAGEHGGGAALQLADLGRHMVAGGVLQAAVEIAGCLQVKQLAHILAGVVFKGRALDDGDLAGLAVAGGVSALDAFGIETKIHDRFPLFFLELRRRKTDRIFSILLD